MTPGNHFRDVQSLLNGIGMVELKDYGVGFAAIDAGVLSQIIPNEHLSSLYAAAIPFMRFSFL